MLMFAVGYEKYQCLLYGEDRFAYSEIGKRLAECLGIWGALHSPNCITGSGFKRARGRWVHKFVVGFRAIGVHPAFRCLCKRLQEGVACYEDYDAVFNFFLAVNAEIR